ncbi:uncharacterized protein LOC129573352 isoform X2 [Sitodiplosis mosellana]|uniref:uncharacterized protein LOC129573352 isoform X2 n=1 Tax=Sitodiplosis mosellana TaxID=263140 RepID=UPI002444859B|nr:uncharacterized protein LOC129573352 isoform X2 [Sitodiplosis mosellana]
MKMRYKVNFHVLLYFLSSCWTMMGSQVPNLLNHGDSKTSSSSNTTTTTTTNDTTEANTFLINVNNNSNHSNDEKAAFEHTTHLASTNDRIATALATNNETNHTKIQTTNGNYSEELRGSTQALESEVTETHQFKSMSSIKEALMLVSPWPPPVVANQLNNKYFVNQVQSNLSTTLLDSNHSATSNGQGIVETSTVATIQAAVGANKYFVSNVSLLSIEDVTQSSSTLSSSSSSSSLSKSRFKATVNPLSASNKNKTVQQQHHHHHGKTNGSAPSSRTHFQIAQKQLTLSKNIRTEPPPMLNHILDSLSVSNSKHLHHDHRYGPHFEDIPTIGNVTNITVPIGNAVYLNCRISLLQDKTVSWVRRKPGESGLELLTVGNQTYSGDSRYKIEFQYPNNWKLKIESVVREDEGTYECQISTYPPRVIQKNIFIIDPKVVIIDEEGSALQDKYYEVDSTLQLSCIVRNVKMMSSAVYWSHGERILNYDVERGGISVKTEILDKGANSSLLIAKINKADSGNYSCFINATHEYTVSVHVLNESFAELHHGNGAIAAMKHDLSTELHIFLLILLNVIWFYVQQAHGR